MLGRQDAWTRVGIFDKDGRDVGVTNQTNPALVSGKNVSRDVRIDDVFPNRVARAAVRECDVAFFDHYVEQFQKITGFRIEHLRLDSDSARCLFVEGVNVDITHQGSIMIAHNATQAGLLAQQGNTFIWVGTIPHHITQAPNPVKTASVR